ncbi:nicotinate phosphoribosyltransferase [Microbispora sp. H10830]|uniref:nicotinate phosphoribosyltransferase n=1 Tax=Microbispora sp. H10830 TaxID=2729109 RepID=UPI0016032880|nr:nicotinate phosphoribosyltransferase [Microbispora sp. H10830]
MASGLLTDLYEINMAASYLRRGMTGRATFSLFVRRLPANRGFLVTAGLDDCLEFLEGFHFTAAELDYLERTGQYGHDVLRGLERMRFTGDVWAAPEGSTLFADEPIIEVSGPIAEAQLAETVLLNHITFQTTAATKAARCVLAAGRARLIDFAFRRTQGIGAAMSVARASAIAGFSATSNVEAARRYGLRAAGTMAHSYIQAFGDDEAAFAAFAADLPGANTFLVDTYDTLTGVRAAIAVSRRMRLPGPLVVRLDSGDLADLSRQARRMLDEAGLPDAEILASGGLDEYAIDDLVRQGAPIDIYAVGTKMGVSADAPSLNSAYKLVDYGGRPVMKLSAGKVTLPGAKQVFRGESGDIVGLRDEPAPPGHRPLLAPVMEAGRRLAPSEAIATSRDRCAAELARLPAPARALRDPRAPQVRHSERLTLLSQRVRHEIHARTAADEFRSRGCGDR